METKEERKDSIKSHKTNGTLYSDMFNDIIKAGFKPIAITVMACEETFVFETENEATEASKLFLPEGWWHGKATFEEARFRYVHEAYDGNFEKAPIVYWLKDKDKYDTEAKKSFVTIFDKEGKEELEFMNVVNMQYYIGKWLDLTYDSFKDIKKYGTEIKENDKIISFKFPCSTVSRYDLMHNII